MNIVCKDYDPKSWSCQTCQARSSHGTIIFGSPDIIFDTKDQAEEHFSSRFHDILRTVIDNVSSAIGLDMDYDMLKKDIVLGHGSAEDQRFDCEGIEIVDAEYEEVRNG